MRPLTAHCGGGSLRSSLPGAFVGAVCAAITTYIAVKFLLRYFETNRLTPFGIYCIVVGTILTIVFAVS